VGVLKKKQRQDQTQFITKIGRKTSLVPSKDKIKLSLSPKLVEKLVWVPSKDKMKLSLSPKLVE
jgi:hypothetical protein